MAQNVTIQGLTSKEISEISTSTPLPMQIANTENFQKVTVGQLQSDCYAICATASNVAKKTATVTNFPDFEIHIGSKINVIFENENTASNVTLQILNQDGSSATGEIPVVAKNSANVRLGSGSIKAGTYSFSYNGSYFVADTYLVEQTSTYTKYADGHTEYKPISSLDTGSGAPVNSSAVNGALAEYCKISAEDFNNVTDCNDAYSSFNGNKPSHATYKTSYKPSNAPTEENAFWYIESYVAYNTTTGHRCVQIAISSNGLKYTRTGTHTSSATEWTWSSWGKITTETDLNNALANYPKILQAEIKVGETARITLVNPYFTSYLISISRDGSSDRYLGFLTWYWNSNIQITWFVSSSGITVTKVDDKNIDITTTNNSNVCISCIPLNKYNTLSISKQ